MLRALVYMLIGLGWLTFVGGVVLAVASFVNNTWTLQLHLPVIFNSSITTGFAVLFVASVTTIILLASAEMIVMCLESYNDIKKIREFFHKK